MISFSRRSRILLAICLLTAQAARAQMPGQQVPDQPVITVNQTDNGLHATVGNEDLEVSVCEETVIHVVATPEASAKPSPQPWMLDPKQSCPGGTFQFAKSDSVATLETTQLR